MHHLPITETAEKLFTSTEKGIAASDIEARRAKSGFNELTEKKRAGLFSLIFNQLNNFLVIILIIAAIVSFLLEEPIDGSAILAIVLINAILGIIQESKAENALAALKRMAAPNAVVLRDGQRLTIPGRELVPGDIVILEAGNYVPADLRLSESVNLKINESSLTGESNPVNKDAQVVLDKDIPLGDKHNTAFMGTMVTYGRGTGIVVSTGMNTEMGKIAEMLQSYTEEPTPLQKKLDQLGKWLGIFALGICLLILIIGILRDTNVAMIFQQGVGAYLENNTDTLQRLFMTAVGLAIAGVPEGLPAVVTICLALGMQHMIRRHALIRKLPAVETLGCTTVICSDKTGTLTQNAMTVKEIVTADTGFTVTGDGYAPEGKFFIDEHEATVEEAPSLSSLLYGALVCNDAHIRPDETGNSRTWVLTGDPTEGALVTVAGKAGFTKEKAGETLPRIAEIPFDSERKRMTTIHEIMAENVIPELKSGYIAFTKGAPDMLLECCSKIYQNGTIQPLTPEKKAGLLAKNSEMAGRALRVLGVAVSQVSSVPEEPKPEEIEQNLIFLGLLGMIDPPRTEVIAALKTAKDAGIKTVMVTGDYKETAAAIAGKIGLLSENGKVFSGSEIDSFSDAEFAAIVEQTDAFARVSPQHKVKIVDALRQKGHVVAMTGDGVNDAPALKRADIGIAMGITGTDVTKETADVVLTDDNYTSIVAAVEQGRIIYSNIRKFVLYLLACNIGEILIMFSALLLGMPIPLSPLMLLWLNLITDGAPAIALGLESGEPGIMKLPPRPPKEPVINQRMTFSILLIAVADAAAVLSAYVFALNRHPGEPGVPIAMTVAFATLVCSELVRAFTSRSELLSIFSIGIFKNKTMILATSGSLLLLLAVLYFPPLSSVFKTVPLTGTDWLYMLPFVFIAPLVQEIIKFVNRRLLKKNLQ
ncbi:MAG: cation-translocating P-type ATPase [Spirochaetales bacterium]|nr:cation-translocating P-type ATPase [Spirochaetales bacterium]